MNRIAMDRALDKHTSSPYRERNFDLLQLLSLQEAIHRTLREYMSAGESKEVSFHFLREFYIDRLSSHFDGYQVHGRADDFLEELLLTMPSLKTSTSSGGCGGCGGGDRVHMEFIDPVNIARDIIGERSEVLFDWKDDMGRVADDHIGLRKAMWTKQMGELVGGSDGETPLSSQSITADVGAFE